MEIITDTIESIRSVKKRDVVLQLLSLATVVLSALMLWKGLMVVTGSESPIVVVLSGSMEPGFSRGDLLFLTMGDEPLEVGDIVVFKVSTRDVPIVHRILEIHRDSNGAVRILTKGDANPVDDRGLYAPGQLWLSEKDIVGRAKGYVPYIGIATILMNDYPKLKYALLTILAFTVITSKE